jgi:hypothetical protein
LEITGGVPSRIVEFRNQFANIIGTDPCSEALYVHHLILRAGSDVLLNNASIYYDVLTDEGADVATIGCGQLLMARVACTSALVCDDDNACSNDQCQGGFCVSEITQFGDVNGMGAVGADLDDILCVLRGFTDPSNCPNADIAPTTGPMACQGNGVIDIEDLLAALGAFGGTDPCACSP